jgi:hypothetical protein
MPCSPAPIANTSSPRLRIQFENGSGLVLAAARVLVLVRWLPAAIVPAQQRGHRTAMPGDDVAEGGDRQSRRRQPDG